MSDGVLEPSPSMLWVWWAALGFAYLCLVLFVAVGIISTTSTFNKKFLKTFFWVAVIWTMAATSLLVGIVKVLGASGKDCLGAWLASVAISMVFIQIGQSHLEFQDPTGEGILGSAPSNGTG